MQWKAGQLKCGIVKSRDVAVSISCVTLQFVGL